jgi:serine/threonine-protein kinase
MALFNKLLRLGIYAALFLGALLCSFYLASKWIIQGEKEVVVPNLVGHDTVYALDLLTSLGLNIKVGGFMWSETIPKNVIAFQEPASGTRLKRDRDVKVVLSRGSKTVRVPNLVGVNIREAELVLSQNGLNRGGICRIHSPQHPRDTVIAQSPAPLQQTERGQGIDVLISDGPEPVAIAMPELRHQPIGQALKQLERQGLATVTIKEVHQAGMTLDTIVGQRPPSGYRVDLDKPVVLKLNRLPQSTGHKARFWWIAYQVPEGYFKKEVALTTTLDDREMLLYRKIHRPADRLAWLVWARSPREISIYLDGLTQNLEPSGFAWDKIGVLSRSLAGEKIMPLPLRQPWRTP